MKIHFITHSSFLVETAKICMLFDWYEGDIPEIPQDKPLFIFASHSHEDHFSDKIFEATKDHSTKYFVLSSDIFKSKVPVQYHENCHFISPYQTLKIDDVEIKTYMSTDMGVAFLINTDGKNFYHAGDLNCWTWEGAPRFQNNMMENTYKEELKKISSTEIFMAFVPLDPRQDSYFDLGMKYFLETCGASYVFPMHMWGVYSIIDIFKQKYPEYAPMLFSITGDNQSFEIPD